MKYIIVLSLVVFISCKQRPPHRIETDSLGNEKVVVIKKGDSFHGKVIKISDGDTFRVLFEQTSIRIRMNSIDCPEKKQDFYQVAKDALASLIFNREVRITVSGYDRYGRVLGDVFINDLNINLAMVEGGFAWHYKKYSSSQLFADAENRAKMALRGLWSMSNPIAPWYFR